MKDKAHGAQCSVYFEAVRKVRFMKLGKIFLFTADLLLLNSGFAIDFLFVLRIYWIKSI